MTIKQISVFLENKGGRLNEVARVLAANDINMLAFCIAETTDFGLMRLIVQEVDRAVEALRNAVAEFEQLAYPTTSRLKYERREKQMGKVYTH